MTNSPHHPKELSYWDRVTLARETDNHDFLAWIIANECEDDFRAAVAENTIATEEDIRWAADYHAYWVRVRVVANKKTPLDILLTFVADATKTIEENLQPSRSPSVMQHHHAAMVDDSVDLIKDIVKELKSRATATSADHKAMTAQAGK